MVRSWIISLSLCTAIAGGTALFANLAKRLTVTTVRPLLPHKTLQSAAQTGRIMIAADQQREADAMGPIDQPLTSLLNIRSPLTYGEFVWNDRGVQAGKVWMRIDLASQILSVFRGGDEIGTAVILYGADGVPTPTGRFPIRAKFRNHRSSTYDGAPMPYTLRLTADGVSIHGSNVRQGFATHGCIGVPAAFAAKLFEVTSVGDPVTIVSGTSRDS